LIDKFCQKLKARGVTGLVLVMVRKPRFTVLSMSQMPKKKGSEVSKQQLNDKKAKKKRQATVLAVLGLEPRLARIWIGQF
jgi:hypothetical protein